MSDRFVNRVVVVTGAASGLGQTSACRFAAEGAQLVLIDLNEKGLEETAAKVKALGAKCSVHAFDLSHENAINQFGGNSRVVQQRRCRVWRSYSNG